MHKSALMPLTAPAASSETVRAGPMGLRCVRRSVVVFAGSATASDQAARALQQARGELGVEVSYVSEENDACRIAAKVVAERADTVKLCLGEGASGVPLLRQLLRRLIEAGRRDVSIIVHRVR